MRTLAETDVESVLKVFREHGLLWAIFLAILFLIFLFWHEILDDPIKEHLFRRYIKRRLLKHHFIEDLVSDMFEGKVEVITEALLKKKASKERVLQFYGGAKLHWDIIAANGDIPRDQAIELKTLSEKQSVGTYLLCITAEAGAGKSTIAWRIAADIIQHNSAEVVLHVLANDAPDVWQRMPDFQRELRRPLFVLVDDIFRDQDAANAFIDLAPNLPLKVLGTSRRNEFRSRAKRLKCECVEYRLNPPSAKEKQWVLNKLGKTRHDLTADQKQRLDNADQFIVLMIELGSGRELHEVLRDTIAKLHELEPNHSAYRAYGYICFAGQFSISTPESILEKLDRAFVRLKDRSVVEGLVFPDDRPGNVRSGHSVVARSVAEIYAAESGYSAKQTIRELLSAVDENNLVERSFAGFLLRAAATTKLIEPESLCDLAKDLPSRCITKAEGIGELILWRSFYLLCNQRSQAERCAELAIARELASQHECDLLLHLCRERGTERDALQPIAKCIRSYPAQGAGRVPYLGLVEKYARQDIDSAIQETDAWLQTTPDDSYVRHAFLSFVERNRREVIANYITLYDEWLQKNAEESSIRGKWLGVVARNGTEVQIRKAISAAVKWLHKPENRNDIQTRKGLLSLLRRHSLMHREVRNNSDEWLLNKGIVNDATALDQILHSTIEWLGAHPEAKEIWDGLLGLYFSLGRIDEARMLLSKAISYHPNDQNLLAHYLSALYESDRHYDEIKRIFDHLIKAYPDHVITKVNHAAWLRDKGDPQEAEQYYRRLIAEYPRQYGPRFGLGQLYLKAERFPEACKQFDYVLKMPGGHRHQMAHEGFAMALWKLGRIPEAEKEVKLAIKWANGKDEPTARFYTLLGRIYLDWNQDGPRWTDALEAFMTARDDDPDYYGNYFGMGRAFFGLNNFSDAAHALRTAIELKPELRPPASEEIRALLDQCLMRLRRIKETARSEESTS